MVDSHRSSGLIKYFYRAQGINIRNYGLAYTLHPTDLRLGRVLSSYFYPLSFLGFRNRYIKQNLLQTVFSIKGIFVLDFT